MGLVGKPSLGMVLHKMILALHKALLALQLDHSMVFQNSSNSFGRLHSLRREQEGLKLLAL